MTKEERKQQFHDALMVIGNKENDQFLMNLGANMMAYYKHSGDLDKVMKLSKALDKETPLDMLEWGTVMALQGIQAYAKQCQGGKEDIV